MYSFHVSPSLSASLRTSLSVTLAAVHVFLGMFTTFSGFHPASSLLEYLHAFSLKPFTRNMVFSRDHVH